MQTARCMRAARLPRDEDQRDCAEGRRIEDMTHDYKATLEAVKNRSIDAQTNKLRVLLSISEHLATISALEAAQKVDGMPEQFSKNEFLNRMNAQHYNRDVIFGAAAFVEQFPNGLKITKEHSDE